MAKAKVARMREASSEGALAQVTRPNDADGDGDDDGPKGNCPTCKGDGVTNDDVCPTCNGTGTAPAEMSEAAGAEDEDTLCTVCLTADCGVEDVSRIREATLTAKARKAIAPSNFAIPSKAPDSGSYPIHDLSHAQNALARSSGKPEEGTVKSAVYKKWPSLKPGASSTSEAANAADDKVECPTCHGSGKMLGGNMTCKTCDGTGKVTAEKAAALKKSSGSKPPWLSETKATLVERIEALEDDAGIFRSLREAKPGVLSATYSTPTRVKTSDGREGYEVVLIREGLGNATDDNWYTADAIKEMCEAGVAEGMQAYANHPDLEEEQNRPERDVKQLVGSYADVQFMESGGVPRAKAVLVPMTTDEMHPTYGWVVTLAEAAANNTGPQPLAGISLYGLSAGDYGPRPDGSEGRMVTMIRPTSGDVVTNAGAGGEFVRKTLRESARRLRRATQPRKEEPAMKVDEFNKKFAEATSHMREADSDEKRAAAQAEFDTLAEAKVDAPAPVPNSIEALTEAAPALVTQLREASKAEAEDLKAQLAEATEKLGKAESFISGITDVQALAGALHEAGVTDESELRHFVGQAQSRGLREAADVKDMVEAERAYDKAKETALLEKVKESMDLPDVEGIFFRTPGTESTDTDGGEAFLRESGIPTKAPAAA